MSFSGILQNEVLWTWVGRVCDIVSFVGILAFWWTYATRIAAIPIVLTSRGTSEKLLLPYHPRRDHLNRSELLGILGMFYGADRLPLEKTNFNQLFQKENGDFEKVISGKQHQFTIEFHSDLFIEITEK